MKQKKLKFKPKVRYYGKNKKSKNLKIREIILFIVIIIFLFDSFKECNFFKNLENKYNLFIANSNKIEREYDIHNVKDFKLINTIYINKDEEGISSIKYTMYHNYNLSYLYDCTIKTKDIEGNDISIETSNYLFEHHNIHFNEDISYDDYTPMIEVYEAKMPVKLGFLTLYENVLYYNIKANRHVFYDGDK